MQIKGLKKMKPDEWRCLGAGSAASSGASSTASQLSPAVLQQSWYIYEIVYYGIS